MSRLLTIPQTSFTGGEVDVLLLGRNDAALYMKSAEKARNVLTLPQGGFRRRPGLAYVDTLPKILQRETGMTITCPEGGTTANANDDDTSTEVVSTNNISTTDPFVLVHYDLGAATTIKFADVRGLRVSGGSGGGDEWRIQYSTDNVSWTDAMVFDAIDTADTNRRIRVGVSARYWRVAKVGGTDAGLNKGHIDEFWVWTETATISAARPIAFQFSTTQRFMIAMTDRNLAVYKADDYTRVADVHIPHESADVMTTRWVQSLDTLLLFHEDHQPLNVQRQGANDEWQDAPQTFSNIPQYDFGSGNEDIMSSTRGWPTCGTFHEGRLFIGGLKSLPSRLLGSKVASFFDLDEGTGLDDEAINAALDTDDVAAIYNLNSGRHLQIFTSSGEHYVPQAGTPITPSNFSAPRTTRIGSRGPGIPVVDVEGAVLFLQRASGSCREFLYTDLEQAYAAQNISLLASHLIVTPVDMSLRRALTTDDGNLVAIVNSDGTLAILNTLRSQEVTGWMLWNTDGNIKSVAGDLEDLWAVVERTINGATVVMLERFDQDYFLDSSLRFTSGLPTATFAIAHLEAETVDVYADQAVLGSETVSSGSVTIDRDAATQVEIGLPFPDVDGNGNGAWVRMLRVEPRFQSGTVMTRKKRVVELGVQLYETQHLKVGVNGRAPVDISFREFGEDLLDDVPAIFTGVKDIRGHLGYSTEAYVDFAQDTPGPMTVLWAQRKVSI